MGRTSPEAVTVCLSSGLFSILITTTSGSSLRVANTLTITTMASTAATETPIMIFFLRLNAMFSSFDQGLKFLIEHEVVVLIRETVYARSSFYVKSYQTVSFNTKLQKRFEAQNGLLVCRGPIVDAES